MEQMRFGKNITFALIIIALIIWGAIVVKVFKVFRPYEKKGDVVKTENRRSVEKIRILSLDYRDPFLGVTYNKKEEGTSLRVSKKKNIEHLMKVENPTFIYKGLISGEEGAFGVILIKNETVLIKKGQTIEGFKILEITPEKLFIGKNGKKYEIEAK